MRNLQEVQDNQVHNQEMQSQDKQGTAPASDRPLNRAPEPQRSRPVLTALQYIALLSVAGLFGSLSFGLISTWRTGSSLMSRLTAPQPPAQVDVRTVLVQQVRGASELTTAVFAMESVVPASRDRTLAGYTVGTTTLLYMAYGEVRAGVDLSDMTPQNIQVDGDQITVTLPPPQILDSKIDVARSSVYDYDRGFLGLGPDVAPELQQLAQTETLAKIVDAACRENLLDEANVRAELVVTQLLSTAGYGNVTVKSQAADPAACAAASTTPAPTPATETQP